MKNIINNIKGNYKLVISVLIVGLILGWLFFHSSNETMVHEDQIEGHEGHNHESNDPSIWTCSMHPQIKQDEPGQCPICAMDLIPLAPIQLSGDDVDPNEIVLTEYAVKLAEIQTLIVSAGTPQKSVYLQGKVQEDERNIAELTARFGGRIEKLFVNYTGQNVKQGDKLASIYSPDLVNAQMELLEAISFKDSRPSLYKAAIAKLTLWGLTEEQISSIENDGEPQVYFDVLAPISGTVSMRHVALGDYIKEGTALFRLVDLSKVWVMFDAYESDLPWIKLKDNVNFNIQALPGKDYSAKVTYIDPFINRNTRIAKVRVELDNKNRDLKPEMFVNGKVESKIAENSHEILIPKSAVLWTGKRAVVYVKVPNREKPSFLYREVKLGPESGAFYVISEGLMEGEEIAVNGVFKIDAASQLIGLPSMMNPDGGKVSTAHNHADMPGSNSSESHEGHEEMNISDEPVKVPADFKKQLTNVYNSYLPMKDAFVASDAGNVSKEAARVIIVLKEVDMGLLKGEAHMIWMEYLDDLESALKSIAENSDLEKQRIDFSMFNLVFYKSIQSFGLEEETAYYQYCPMAIGDEGAYWFSNSKEISNPYFGDEMLRCGETMEIIK